MGEDRHRHEDTVSRGGGCISRDAAGRAAGAGGPRESRRPPPPPPRSNRLRATSRHRPRPSIRWRSCIKRRLRRPPIQPPRPPIQPSRPPIRRRARRPAVSAPRRPSRCARRPSRCARRHRGSRPTGRSSVAHAGRWHAAPGEPGCTAAGVHDGSEPKDPDSPNVSYLKDLWQAVQSHEISGKEAVIMGLAQRGMNTPYPQQAPGPNVPTAPVDPAAAPPLLPPPGDAAPPAPALSPPAAPQPPAAPVEAPLPPSRTCRGTTARLSRHHAAPSRHHQRRP